MRPNVNIEIAVIKRFILKNKQERYIQFATSISKREKFVNDLCKVNVLNHDLLERVEEPSMKIILEALHRYSIKDKTCYVISENKLIDTKVLDIKAAFGEVEGFGMETVLVFGKGDVIFCECEALNTRFISK